MRMIAWIVFALAVTIACAAVEVGVSQYTDSREAIPFDDEQAKKSKIIELAEAEVRTRFLRERIEVLYLERQLLYWKYWQNDTVKTRVRSNDRQGFREIDHAFSINFHVKLRAYSGDGIAYRHHVVLNLESRRQNPSIIGHWFSEETGSPFLNILPQHSSDDHVADVVPILSWNVWNFNTPWAERVERLAAYIRQHSPAIIGFQEMRYDAVNSPSELGPPFQVRHLADRLPEYQYIYQPAMVYLNQGEHTDEGLAIFSRWPIVQTSWTPLSRDRSDREDDHQRILLRAQVLTPRGALVNFFVTHLSLSAAARRRTAVEIWHFIRQFDPPCILVGDFNEEPNSELLDFLQGRLTLQNEHGDMRDSWEVLNGNGREQAGWTFDTRNLRKRIDFVMIRGSEIQPEKLNLIGHMTDRADQIASDHLGVLVQMHVDVPMASTMESEDDVQLYFTTSWWLTMVVVGCIFVALDFFCCCIAWQSK